jgi:hypothetical protein
VNYEFQKSGLIPLWNNVFYSKPEKSETLIVVDVTMKVFALEISWFLISFEKLLDHAWASIVLNEL